MNLKKNSVIRKIGVAQKHEANDDVSEANKS